MNFNLPEKKLANQSELDLFPLATNQKNIEKETNNLPPHIQKIVRYYLLVDSNNKYEDISVFLECVQGKKSLPLEQIHNPALYNVLKTAHRIQRQIHKLKGLLRFREIEGGYLYAEFAPDYDVIIPLAIHFSNRFPDEKIILHDIKRKKALFIEEGNFFEVVFNNQIPENTKEENLFQHLWKQYHQNISIKERENKELQRQNLSLKFQKWLIELDNKK